MRSRRSLAPSSLSFTPLMTVGGRGEALLPNAISKAIAKSIIETAKAGELDPVRLREAGLAALRTDAGGRAPSADIATASSTVALAKQFEADGLSYRKIKGRSLPSLATSRALASWTHRQCRKCWRIKK